MRHTGRFQGPLRRARGVRQNPGMRSLRSLRPPRDPDVTAYRSRPALATGVVLLGVGVWMAIDTIVHGSGRTRWVTLAALLFAGVFVTAFTLRPVVLAGPARLVIRNPFRTITVPWADVADVRAEYSLEVRTKEADRGFHVWAVPVSLKERKRAARSNQRAAAEDVFGRGATHAVPEAAFADLVANDLRGLAERFAKTSTGAARAVWSREVLLPLLVTALLIVVAAVA